MFQTRLKENLPRVREAIEKAAKRAGRDPEEVKLVAITKAHPLEALQAALAAGIRDLGENRIEELEEKVGLLGREVATWHMVGHVQSRKAKQAAEMSDLIHSVDTVKLARRISGFSLEREKRVPVLLQVNASGEETKSGFPLDRAMDALHEVVEMGGIEVRGFMTMAPFDEDERILRRAFRALRRVQEDAGRLPVYQGRELSMGMTNDFELAVEEGSTMVRIGTALFGERSR